MSVTEDLNIRVASAEQDGPAVWPILEPMLRAGETYALPSDWSESQAIAYWFDPAHLVFIAERSGFAVGAYYLQRNQRGGGSHVANCGYVTAPAARRRGVARAMCLHSLEEGRRRGFRAMQFNLVVSTNIHAVALWQELGFCIVGRLPGAFRHPSDGYVDALVMFRSLIDVGSANADTDLDGTA